MHSVYTMHVQPLKYLSQGQETTHHNTTYVRTLSLYTADFYKVLHLDSQQSKQNNIDKMPDYD